MKGFIYQGGARSDAAHAGNNAWNNHLNERIFQPSWRSLMFSIATYSVAVIPREDMMEGSLI